MKFAYEDLSDDQFEKLIVFLCQHLLGISVQGFAKGPDGGRDAKFVGTAELHVNRPGFRRHLAAINYGLGGGGYEHEALHG